MFVPGSIALPPGSHEFLISAISASSKLDSAPTLTLNSTESSGLDSDQRRLLVTLTAQGRRLKSEVLPYAAKLNRKAVPLAVLNGTTVTGLARGAADKLTTKGYNEPNVVTNDTTNQARPTTQIFYEAKVRAAALDVAKILGVPTAQVKPMDANARALADRAEVAVFVGADKAQ